MLTAGTPRASEASAGGVRGTASWREGTQEENVHGQVLGGIPAAA